MDGATTLDTRARIMETALDLFAEQGYQRTSMREIADRLGITKAAVFYHFPAKAQLLASLSEPLVEDVEVAIKDALYAAETTGDAERARWLLIESLLDTYLRHRRLLRILMHDLTVLAHDHAFQRFVTLAERIHQIVAGPGADLPGRVRAVQAIAMIGDPVVFFPDTPDERIREEILSGVRTLLQTSPVVPAQPGRPARPRHRRAGRPPALDAARAAEARRLHAAGTHTVTEIAEALGVSRATVYRHLAEPRD
ncbi:TetR/AcrR family transcriptional regulator [Thermomonospora cellulosilytica]|uniref:AcrR family transcriptional regulator n=1 Tax=Thermomonospora cellulosilytica TaxID=1411118 RepID=A0A7W3MTK0_9ACTN|nr:TetR family transcriptional regulator [Thermomonospora cellulosilytica]MBA9001639.1 AcrR family transcriptional regulator [Thermomonospora cellulosilytica]